MLAVRWIAWLGGWYANVLLLTPAKDTLPLMEYDKEKVDDMVLALLYLTLHDDNRAWKGHEWGALGRLHAKGMIGDPVGKAKSVWLTDEGLQRSRELFMRYFTAEARDTT